MEVCPLFSAWYHNLKFSPLYSKQRFIALIRTSYASPRQMPNIIETKAVPRKANLKKAEFKLVHHLAVIEGKDVFVNSLILVCPSGFLFYLLCQTDNRVYCF
jgi:hypothetical protein